MVTSGSAAPGSGEQKPPAGYYPDPSIPGYVRYWNGSAWVPGSSRPEPGPGEVLSPPPGAEQAVSGASGLSAPAAPPAPPAPRAPLPTPARTPSVEESGPMFLDEDPQAPVAQTSAEPARPVDPASAAARPAAAPPGGSSGFPPAPGSAGGYGYPNAAGSAGGRPAGGYGYPSAGSAAPGGGYGYPNAAGGSGGYGRPQAGSAGADEGASWQRQVQELARKDATPGVPGQAKSSPGEDNPQLPWRPPVHNPFLLAAQEQARPAAPVRRLVARIVDSLLVGVVVAAAAAPLALASVRHIQHKIDAARQTGETVQVWLIDGTTGLYLGIVLAALLLTGLLYEVLPTAKWGRTLGKKLLGLQVLDIESQLTPGFGQALRRMLVYYGLQLVGVGILDALWCLFDRPWRQTWHDKAARTFVAGSN